jgi:hypothetical protein
MSVLVEDFISDSGLSIRASVSYLQKFPSFLHMCEEAKCQLEKLMKNPVQARKLLSRFGKSLSR